MRYLIPLVAVLGIVVIGSQLMLMVPEGWPAGIVALLTFVAAAGSGRYLYRRGSGR